MVTTMGAVSTPDRRGRPSGRTVRRVFAVALLASSVPLLALAADSGHGYSAGQQVTSPITQAVGSGDIAVAIDGTGPLSSVTVGAVNLSPGSTVQRAVTVKNAGTSPFGSLSMYLATTSSGSPLVTGGGVAVSADYCAAGWQATAVGGGWTYSCPAAPAPVFGPVTLSSAVHSVALSAPFSTLTPGESATMRVTATLPTTDGNAVEGASVGIVYRFVATQVTP